MKRVVLPSKQQGLHSILFCVCVCVCVCVCESQRRIERVYVVNSSSSSCTRRERKESKQVDCNACKGEHKEWGNVECGVERPTFTHSNIYLLNTQRKRGLKNPR